LLARVAQLACDGEPDENSVRATVDAIGPRPFEVADALQLFDVDTPDDLLQAAAMFP
jgi:CTP:molybdopterin cytidylyltransferase MocA